MLKRVKTEVNEVGKGLECGMQFEGFTSFQAGDTIQVGLVFVGRCSRSTVADAVEPLSVDQTGGDQAQAALNGHLLCNDLRAGENKQPSSTGHPRDCDSLVLNRETVGRFCFTEKRHYPAALSGFGHYPAMGTVPSFSSASERKGVCEAFRMGTLQAPLPFDGCPTLAGHRSNGFSSFSVELSPP